MFSAPRKTKTPLRLHKQAPWAMQKELAPALQGGFCTCSKEFEQFLDVIRCCEFPAFDPAIFKADD